MWTWIVGALVVVGILFTVFAMLGRTRGARNQTLPGARIPASSMVADASLAGRA